MLSCCDSGGILRAAGFGAGFASGIASIVPLSPKLFPPSRMVNSGGVGINASVASGIVPGPISAILHGFGPASHSDVPCGGLC